MKLSLQKLLKVLILSYGIQSLESIVVNDDIGGDSNSTPSVLAVGDDDTYRRVIVKYIGEPEDTQSSVRKSVSRSVNMITSAFVKETNAEIMILNNSQIKELEEDRNVEFVENDVKVYMIPGYQQTTNTTVHQMAEFIPYGIKKVNAPNVDTSYVSNRKICIIDNGYDIDHPDLPVTNVDGYTGSDSAGLWYQGGNSHGTHVAGTIVAIGDNSIGVVGVVPTGTMPLYIVRVFDDKGQWAWGSTLVHAMYKCSDVESNIINMSLGSLEYSVYWKNACDDLFFNKDILLVAAAGNNGDSSYMYPASYDSVMSVAAINKNDKKAIFSQYNDQVNIAAPGVGIASTISGASYTSWSGTSMSTPHVSGVAALVWSHFATRTATNIREVLESTAKYLGNPDKFGSGLIDAEAAFDFLTPSLVAAPSTSPSEDCLDSSLEVGMRTNNNNKVRFETCELWVINKPNRCRNVGVSETCPMTCGSCSICIDSPFRFRVELAGVIKKKNCDWVRRKKKRCKVTGVPNICRETCKTCTDDS